MEHDCQHVFHGEALTEALSRMNVDKEARERTMRILERYRVQEAESLDNPDQQRPYTNQVEEEKFRDSDSSNLLKSLEGIDLESASVETLWNRLTKKGQQEFIRILETTGASQSLLAHAWEPWWIGRDPIIVEMEQPTKSPKPASLPPISDDIKPLSRHKSEKISSKLVFNVMELMSSFAYLCRWLDGNLEGSDRGHLAATTILSMCRTLATNEPFLFEGVIPFIDEWKYRLMTNSPFALDEYLFRHSIEDACILVGSKLHLLRGLSELRRLCHSMSATSRSHRLAERKIYFYQCWLLEAYDFLDLSVSIFEARHYLASQSPLPHHMYTESDTT
jgi:hypothetical protein